MNDTELDRLLDMWEAPAPPPSLRRDLRARFPRTERPRFTHPLRWVLAMAIASGLLALGMAQTSENPGDFRLVSLVNDMYEKLLEGIEVWQVTSIVAQIRQSEPKVYVDGQLAAPLKYGYAATMNVQVPGGGVYSITAHHLKLKGWVEAGRIHGSVIEVLADGKRVRIECNRPIVDADRPVFVMRRP